MPPTPTTGQSGAGSEHPPAVATPATGSWYRWMVNTAWERLEWAFMLVLAVDRILDPYARHSATSSRLPTGTRCRPEAT